MFQKDDIFDEIEDFVASQENNKAKVDITSIPNKPLSEFFSILIVASSGEDGLIQMLSLFNGKNTVQPITTTTATSSIALNTALQTPTHRSSKSSSHSARNSAVFGLRAKDLQTHAIENDWKYPNAFDEEMYDKWILNFDPTESPPSNVIQLIRESIMEQNAGSRFPLKCCDMVKKSTGDAYLFFAGGAKEYLQGYEVTYNQDKPNEIEWKSLCCTGGDQLNKTRGKRWKKQDQMMQDRIQNMDLRIKSVVVIPSPKYYGKWLVVTGNSRGTIRAYTFDEDRPKEFQFEGEDSTLHKDNNSSSPVLSLTSTYSSETCYHFPSADASNFSPFNHNPMQPRSQRHTKNINKSSAVGGTLGVPSSQSLSAISSQSRNSIQKKTDRIINGYSELPPHLIFSGATDGWIRVWYWDLDSHSIQLVERLAIHLSGVNTIAVSWLDAKFMSKGKNKRRQQQKKDTEKEPSPSLSVTPPPTHGSQISQPMFSYADMIGGDGLLTRRLALVTGGDDQCMTLIIADFESTMSMSRAARKRAKQQQLFRKSMSSSNLRDTNSTKTTLNSRASGWKFNVIREVPINTAHIAAIRSVAITPIITPEVVTYFTKMAKKMDQRDNEEKKIDNAKEEISSDEDDNDKLRMNEILLMSTSDDQRLRCWYYKFERETFEMSTDRRDNIELLDECTLDIGLPNCLSIYYIYNSGILLSIAGQGLQIVTLPFSKYLFKKIYYNRKIREEYRNKQRKKQNANEDNESGSFDSSFSQHGNESFNSNASGT